MKKDEPFDRMLERASRPHSEVRPPEQCLDAERLAAFIDDSLSAGERGAAEAHIADCQRCFAVVAAIAKTTAPPVVDTRLSWLSMRWLVPLATAAIAITAWVFVQPSPTVPAPAPEGALADSAQPREPAAQPQRDTAAQPRIDALEKKAESAPAEKRKEQDLPRRKADTASKPSGVSTLAQSERRSTQAGNAKSGKPRPTSPSAAAAAPSIPPPPADARDERVQQKVSASAPLPITIQSPEAAVQWRITGRTVERTADGGRTWQPQAVTSPSDLLAGRAPSKDVCWIVGRSGLVLLTTDGTTWRRLTFPDESVDLIAITAPDALTATVTTALGRRYRTGDAGRTWTLQENPAAPF